MTDPLRDHETSALARVDELERENEALEKELETEREKHEETVEAEERDPEAQRLEEQMITLKKQVETLKAAPTVEDNSDPAANRMLLSVFIALVLFVAAIAFFLK